MQIYELIPLGFCALATIIFWRRDYLDILKISHPQISLELVVIAIGLLVSLLFWLTHRDNLPSDFSVSIVMLLMYYSFFRGISNRISLGQRITIFHKIWPSLALVILALPLTFLNSSSWDVVRMWVIIMLMISSILVTMYPKQKAKMAFGTDDGSTRPRA